MLVRRQIHTTWRLTGFKGTVRMKLVITTELGVQLIGNYHTQSKKPKRKNKT